MSKKGRVKNIQRESMVVVASPSDVSPNTPNLMKLIYSNMVAYDFSFKKLE